MHFGQNNHVHFDPVVRGIDQIFTETLESENHLLSIIEQILQGRVLRRLILMHTEITYII